MKIDKTTTAEEISRMNVVDACFSGFHYDSESHEIKFELTEEYQKKKFCFRFVNVVLFEMQSCAFWGASPHVYFWEHQHDTEDNTFVCSLFRKEESGFQVPDGYLESVLSMTSGDSLTLVCESVDFTEKSYAVDR